jgi:serine phosphatase RsbU (regulator of sigma subunit)/anti-sigma regulatory factor (Ser/Thr protein kinase)
MFKNLKIGVKIFIILSSVAIAAVGVNGYIGYTAAKTSLEEESFNKLTAIREMKANHIEDYFEQIRNEVITFSEDRMIVDAMKAFNESFRKVDTELGLGETQTSDMKSKVIQFYKLNFLPSLKANLSNSQAQLVDDQFSKYLPKDKNSTVLQYYYIVANPHKKGLKHHLDNAGDGSSYSKAHEFYHPTIRSYLEKFGYYDIFLVDHETGHVVYSVFKEVDYGTSLLTGPYKETNFADVFKESRNTVSKDFVRFVDFDPYYPSFNAPAAFISSPIYDGDQKIGVLIFQMPIDRINNIMTSKQEWSEVGLGDSGETYIIGSDFLIRNQSRFLIEDSSNYFALIQKTGLPEETVNRIRNLNSTIGLQPIKTRGTKAALSGETGTQIFPDYRGVSVLSSYKPLNISVDNISDVNWAIMSEIDEAEAFKYVHYLKNSVIVLLLASIIIILIISLLFSRTLTRPLKTLGRYTEELSRRDFTSSDSFSFLDELLSVARRGDEVGELAQAFQRMETELETSIENLKKTTSAKERMESELNIGREIQMSMIPLTFPAFPDRKEFSLYATLRPAREVGGDFYDFFFIDEDRICLCIGDVSGKGVPSALFMAVTRTLIKSRATDDFSTANIITHVNDELSRDNKAYMFVTIFIGILDIKTGELVYTNAGHNPPYLLRGHGSIERLDQRHGPVIGAMDGLAYKEGKTNLTKGDTLLLYTDGITEAMDSARNLFSEKRLEKLLSSQEFDSVEEVVQSTVTEVKKFEEGMDQTDDITVLAAQYFGALQEIEGSVLEMTVTNQLPEIERFNKSFNSFSEQHDIPTPVRRKMNLVFDELLNNIISYAFRDEDDHDIEIKVELSEYSIKVSITDDGVPFNPFDVEKPDTELSLEERKFGGLGIHLVREVMDKVSYQRRTDKNVTTLVKDMATATK